MRWMSVAAAVSLAAVVLAVPAQAEPGGTGAIEGWTFLDLDSDGVRDADERGTVLAAVRVENVATGEVHDVTGGLSGGSYRVHDLSAGTYEVSAKADQYVATTRKSVRVEVVAGAVAGADFGFRGGVVTGFAWIDENVDGVRQPAEPPLTDTPFMAHGGGFAGSGHTDDEGRYRIEGLPAGAYRLNLYSPSLDRGFTVPGGDSAFDPVTGRTAEFDVAPGGEAGPFGAGFKRAEHDAAVTALRVPERPAVGGEATVEVELHNGGNVPVRLNGEVRFPDGLTPVSVEEGGSVGGQTVTLASSHLADVQPGGSVTFAITARVDRALVDAEVRATTKWVFVEPERDTDPGNNVLVRTISTAEAGPVSTPPGTATSTSTPVVIAAAGATAGLASTGASPVPLLVIGALLLLAGGAAYLVARRRRA